MEQSYLQKVIEGQQAQLALGQLAVHKASSDQVKHYGAHMIEDHQRASEKLQKLISKEGNRRSDVPIPSVEGALSNNRGRSVRPPRKHPH
ncbi:MAG TPA: DUF4142 domain-containing protein [Nitrospira sp.]|nr:DUF4142 domain-containing protein [Nitrospira sp.]